MMMKLVVKLILRVGGAHFYPSSLKVLTPLCRERTSSVTPTPALTHQMLLLATIALALASGANKFVANPIEESGGWLRHPDAVVPETPVSFRISVRQQNMKELHKAALEVSTPGNARYGKYLTIDEISTITHPSPTDFAIVDAWLRSYGINSSLRQREMITVTTTAEHASRLLTTTFHRFLREVDGREVVRASAYHLPAHVAPTNGAIFGLHGTPLPPRQLLLTAEGPSAAAVTPTVIAQTYRVKNAHVDRAGSNKQAVAEFQGQYMDKDDLTKFFSEEVPSMQSGDDQVSKFVGAPYKAGTGVEALLDIEFIMGVAPGVKTEFWEWPDQDFCGDLANYTHELLAPGGPLVNSISYGWQGDLGQVGCDMDVVGVVDDNWAKLAAAGITVFISSGDSGSACSADTCTPSKLKKGVEITAGEYLGAENAPVDQCCQIATEQGAKGFTWHPPPTPATPAQRAAAFERKLVRSRAARLDAHAHTLRSSTPNAPPAPPIPFKKMTYHVEFAEPQFVSTFPKRDIHILDGTVGTDGGTVTVHNVNGTWPDATLLFSKSIPAGHGLDKRNVTLSISGAAKTTVYGIAIAQEGAVHSIQYRTSKDSGGLAAYVLQGANPPPPPPLGNCTLFSSVSATGAAPDNQTTSGGDAIAKSSYVFYPSWPASSPWVTAVGATRFLNQTVGHEEMASDSFGSGGGFSKMFNDTSKYSWQTAAVAKYVQAGPSLPKWPPAGAFPPTGRATPDIAALGEGYQVYVAGNVQAVGGTSASSPAFAGLVSLVNEARLKAGKPQMGFMNPFFYSNPDIFFDVTKGTNAIGRGTGPLPYGFHAAPGWDAATGLGTPLFDKLLAAALEA